MKRIDIPKIADFINYKNNNIKQKFENLKILKRMDHINETKKLEKIKKCATVQQKLNFKIILDQKNKNNYIKCNPTILSREIIKLIVIMNIIM